MFYEYGMRMMNVCFNDQSYLAHGSWARYADVAGLSNAGIEVIERMNDVGMIINLDHCGAKSVLDAIEVSKDPCVITRACAQGATGQKSFFCMSDGVIHALAEKNGVMAIMALNQYISSRERDGVWSMLDHIDYIVDLVGVDHVAIGSDKCFGYQWDFDGYIRTLGKLGIAKRSEYFEGLQEPDEWPNITRGLVLRGYSDQEIAKIVGGNALRIMDKVIK
jgi:membrane dipeptidase